MQRNTVYVGISGVASQRGGGGGAVKLHWLVQWRTQDSTKGGGTTGDLPQQQETKGSGDSDPSRHGFFRVFTRKTIILA